MSNTSEVTGEDRLGGQSATCPAVRVRRPGCKTRRVVAGDDQVPAIQPVTAAAQRCLTPWGGRAHGHMILGRSRLGPAAGLREPCADSRPVLGEGDFVALPGGVMRRCAAARRWPGRQVELGSQGTTYGDFALGGTPVPGVAGRGLRQALPAVKRGGRPGPLTTSGWCSASAIPVVQPAADASTYRHAWLLEQSTSSLRRRVD